MNSPTEPATACRHRILHGDGLSYMATTNDYFDTVFLDPPDNIGLKYDGHKDKMDDYFGWLDDMIFYAIHTANAQSTLVVLAQDGSPLRSWPSVDGVLRHPVTLDAVSPLYLQALLHYEDRWFYQHPGSVSGDAALFRSGICILSAPFGASGKFD